MKHLSLITAEFLKIAGQPQWWLDLSHDEQRHYLDRHPNSRLVLSTTHEDKFKPIDMTNDEVKHRLTHDIDFAKKALIKFWVNWNFNHNNRKPGVGFAESISETMGKLSGQLMRGEQLQPFEEAYILRKLPSYSKQIGHLLRTGEMAAQNVVKSKPSSRDLLRLDKLRNEEADKRDRLEQSGN